jgi:predicted dehydrogenase
MVVLRAAVIGCGHFGRYHAQKYAALPGVELVAVVDHGRASAEAFADEFGVPALADPRELIGRIDVASVTTPTAAHHAIARPLLEAGIHLLIEKPISQTVEEAADLVALARMRGLVLQVGHLERFNPAFLALTDVLGTPLFIEADRLAPFKPRGTDVAVTLDLMIHDLDLILQLVDSPLERLDAVGAPVLSGQDDIVNVRLQFASGCVANVTASRVSLKSERTIRLFQADAYLSIDLMERQALIARRGQGEMFPGVPEIATEHRAFEPNDALLLEIESFLASVRGERPVAVSGEDGLRALDLALRIQQEMRRPQPLAR